MLSLRNLCSFSPELIHTHMSRHGATQPPKLNQDFLSLPVLAQGKDVPALCPGSAGTGNPTCRQQAEQLFRTCVCSCSACCTVLLSCGKASESKLDRHPNCPKIVSGYTLCVHSLSNCCYMFCNGTCVPLLLAISVLLGSRRLRAQKRANHCVPDTTTLRADGPHSDCPAWQEKICTRGVEEELPTTSKLSKGNSSDI